MTRYGTGPVFDRLRNAIAFIIVLVTLLVLLSTAAFAQDATSAPVTNSEWGKYVSVGVVPTGMLAVTVCQDGYPVVHFRSEDVQFQTEEGTAEIWAHEQAHVRQLEASGLTCEENFANLIATPQSLLQAEAQATCAQATYLNARSSESAMALMNRWVTTFIDYINTSDDPAWKITGSDAWRALRANCPLLTSIYVTE